MLFWSTSNSSREKRGRLTVKNMMWHSFICGSSRSESKKRDAVQLLCAAIVARVNFDVKIVYAKADEKPLS